MAFMTAIERFLDAIKGEQAWVEELNAPEIENGSQRGVGGLSCAQRIKSLTIRRL
jgi:hypothetical protein